MNSSCVYYVRPDAHETYHCVCILALTINKKEHNAYLSSTYRLSGGPVCPTGPDVCWRLGCSAPMTVTDVSL